MLRSHRRFLFTVLVCGSLATGSAQGTGSTMAFGFGAGKNPSEKPATPNTSSGAGTVKTKNRVMPVARSQTKPVYPFAMRRALVRGNVIVAFVVDANGTVREAHVKESSHPAFRQAAVDAVEKWKFDAGTVDGKPVNTMMQVPIYFQIEDAVSNTGWSVRRPRKFPDEVPESMRWDTAPVLILYNPPIYPREALMEKRKGKVKVAFMVGRTGRVEKTRITQSAGPDFDGAAQAAVESFKFDPAQQEGVACGAILSMEFTFKSSRSSDASVTGEMKRLLKVLDKNPGQIVELKELDHIPRALTQNPPLYPVDFRGKGIEGAVKLEFIISRRGAVELPKVIEASSPEFGFSAMQAVTDWQFEPPRRNGELVDVRAVIPLVFTPPAGK